MKGPDLENIKRVYLIGIGGIGMSALARYFKSKGKQVEGYDLTSTTLTDKLIEEGIPVTFNDDISALPEYLHSDDVSGDNLVIYTPAIPHAHRAMSYLKERRQSIYKRSEVLGLITQSHRTIAIAGTHGKTTTSCMVAHILRHSGHPCTAFLGGIATNYDTNFLMEDSNTDYTVVVEADEYDRSFLKLHPDVAVITSVDPDHLDIYGEHEDMIEGFMQFAGCIRKGGMLIYRNGLPFSGVDVVSQTYSAAGFADVFAYDVRIEDHKYIFNINYSGKLLKDVTLSWPGRHNVENAVAAFSVAQTIGLNVDQIREALYTFNGVKRRFEYRVNTSQIVYIDDYAHHPTEIDAIVSSVREIYPGKKVLGIFQPHLYSRTRDFADGFARSLSALDEVWLLDIYPAREQPIPGVDSQMIKEKMKNKNVRLIAMADVPEEVKGTDAGVVLTLGAGDIDKLTDPIGRSLTGKFN
jgi:UDP-N-acetylmuramate--alanine ligase